MSNNMYWITTLIFTIILLAILVGELRESDKDTKGSSAFLVMLAYGVFFCLQDMFWGICDSDIIKDDTVLFIASSIFHITIVFTSYYSMKFFLSYLDNQIKRKNLCIAICFTAVLVQFILVTLNFTYPILFRIENGEYVTKSLRPLSFITQYVVYFVSGIITFSCVKRANIKSRDKYKAIFWISVIPLITGIFQLYYYEAPFYSLGYFLECIILHMFIISKDRNELSQERILDSIANAYYSMHLFDLVEDKMEEYIESDIIRNIVGDRKDGQGAINAVMDASVTEEYYDAVKEFVDFSTLSDRLRTHNSISIDFIGNFHGWTRATFISIERDEDGNQKKVMFMTQIIDEEKKKEQEMFAKSNTDQLTKLLNRRAYENDTNGSEEYGENMVYVAIDVNELKAVNDTFGHEAGDELLLGAAQCMKQCFSPYGRVYRTGGDEFVVIISASENELFEIKNDFEEAVSEWKGKLVNNLSVSCGYVLKKEVKGLSIVEISKIADERMYKAKAEYYSKKGVDRRGQAAAHTALCNLYTKILKINLTDDTYSIVNIDEKEQTREMGFAETVSGWLTGFGKSGQVHKDDLDEYLKKTDVGFLKDYFKSDKTSISIYYRRKYGDEFKQAAMEMIPANDYADDNQTLFLYVKEVDKVW